MILNARQNSFLFLFPPDFFNAEIKEKYKKYYQSLILPYDSIEEFMTSTIQSIEFPSWSMTLPQQTRIGGKKQEYKSALPVEDYFKREFTLTFKLTDSYLNYFIFLENAFKFMNFDNKTQTYSPMRLCLLNNEGYLVSSLIFKNPIIKGMNGLNLSYSSATPDFKTFQANFQYLDSDIELDFD